MDMPHEKCNDAILDFQISHLSWFKIQTRWPRCKYNNTLEKQLRNQNHQIKYIQALEAFQKNTA